MDVGFSLAEVILRISAQHFDLHGDFSLPRVYQDGRSEVIIWWALLRMRSV